MTKSNRGVFSNQGDVTLSQIIRSGQFSNSSEISSMPPYLQVSGISDQNCSIYANDKVKQRCFQQSRGRNSKINDPIWPVIKLVTDLSISTLSVGFMTFDHN